MGRFSYFGKLPKSGGFASCRGRRSRELAGGPQGLRGQGAELGGELDAAGRVAGEIYTPEGLFEGYRAPSRREVEVSEAVDGMLGDGWVAVEVGLSKAVVEVYVADEGGHAGALREVVEAKGTRCEGGVSDVEAEADGGVVDGRDLLGQLGGPDGVVVDLPAQDGQLGVVVLDGDNRAYISGQVPGLAQGGSLGGELVLEAVEGVSAPYPLPAWQTTTSASTASANRMLAARTSR